jgi:peptidoglycan hydrolase CwlO-like protein
MAEAGAGDPFDVDDDDWVHGNLPEGLRHVLEKKDEQIAHLQSDLEDLRAELETDASAIEAKFEELLADAQSKEEEIDRLRAIVSHYTGE